MSWLTVLTVFGFALGVFLLVIIGMAVGVILGRRQLQGSCGGLANRTSADGSSNCSLCTNSDNACQELVRKMNSASQTEDSPDEPPIHDECQKDCASEGCSEEHIADCAHPDPTRR